MKTGVLNINVKPISSASSLNTKAMCYNKQ